MLVGLLSLAVVCGCAKEVGEIVVVEEVIEKKHTNRLADETSPYLLQHAHNPVNWYPWGEEAFALAREQDKPLFVSIGYSSCHWCHVMERESFEDEATAAILNEHFIAIKVDREERPDIDAIYMSAVQAMTGSGGWPLNVFLTPELKPFYGGTYFPPEDGYGRPSFKGLLTSIAQAWKGRREEIEKNAGGLTEAIKGYSQTQSVAGGIDAGVPQSAAGVLKHAFDSRRGGFGGAPKFPQEAQLQFMLRYHADTGDAEVLDMATRTLDAMAYGGIYDQLGGGFHRYTVDAEWLVPHFEKMLYNNAQLAQVYLEAYQVTKKPLYNRIARETLDYVLRDMTDAEGGFHAAEDADSEGEEGKFYVWTKQELESTLSESDFKEFSDYYGVTAGGNFEGHNILNVPSEKDDDVVSKLEVARDQLLEVRSKRVRPGKDYKIISAWNGMMISAYAKGYQVLGEKRYLLAAERAARFVKSSMMEGDDLVRTYAGGKRGAPGFLDDYANVANSFVDLYEATGNAAWLLDAQKLAERMTVLFGDENGGGLFFSAGRDKSLLMRRKDYTDGATKSGNSVAVLLLYRLARLTGENSYVELAEGIVAAAATSVSAQPLAYLNMLSSVYFEKGEPLDIVITGKTGDAGTAALVAAVRRRFLPGAVVIVADSSAAGYPDMQKSIPLLEGRGMMDGKATAFVCVGRTCKLPVTTVEELESLIDSL